MIRRLNVLGVVVVAAALTGSGAPRAQTPAATQRVWTGAILERLDRLRAGTMARSR